MTRDELKQRVTFHWST